MPEDPVHSGHPHSSIPQFPHPLGEEAWRGRAGRRECRRQRSAPLALPWPFRPGRTGHSSAESRTQASPEGTQRREVPRPGRAGGQAGRLAGLPGDGRGRAGESREGSQDTAQSCRVSQAQPGPQTAGSAAQSTGLWGRRGGEPGLREVEGRSWRHELANTN